MTDNQTKSPKKSAYRLGLLFLGILVFYFSYKFFWAQTEINEGAEYLGNGMKAILFTFMKAGTVMFFFLFGGYVLINKLVK